MNTKLNVFTLLNSLHGHLVIQFFYSWSLAIWDLGSSSLLCFEYSCSSCCPIAWLLVRITGPTHHIEAQGGTHRGPCHCPPGPSNNLSSPHDLSWRKPPSLRTIEARQEISYRMIAYAMLAPMDRPRGTSG